MKIPKIAVLAIGLLVLSTGCGGGGGGGISTNVATPPQTGLSDEINVAWDQAKVLKPYTTTPVSIRDLESMPPGPVAISLHGCNGPTTDYSDKLALSVILASLGYIVIEPDSYFEDVPGTPLSRLCYPTGGPTYYIPPTALEAIPQRVRDAEFAIAKVRSSRFFDGKNLVVQGHSQGAVVLSRGPKVDGASKILITGYNDCFTSSPWSSSIPKLHIVSQNDPYGGGRVCPPRSSWQFELLPGNVHSVQRTDRGYELIVNFLRLAP